MLMSEHEPRYEVLRAVVRLAQLHKPAVSCGEVAIDLGMDVEDVSNHFEELANEGYIKLLSSYGGANILHVGRPTGPGRQRAKNPPDTPLTHKQTVIEQLEQGCERTE
jgi:predicted ArsR family transcriptional regulator